MIKAKPEKLSIYLALDMDQPEEALKWVKRLHGFLLGFKIGPRLLLRGGPALAESIDKMGSSLFIDFKFHDIPSTTCAAVQTAFELGASVTTVHAANSRNALLDLAKLESELNQKREFKILGVTVLTSIDSQNRPKSWREAPLSEIVADLSKTWLATGLTGLVCSPFEAASIKNQYPQAHLVCPGVHVGEQSAADQKRSMEITDALTCGADALVVGRALLNHPHPENLLESWYESTP